VLVELKAIRTYTENEIAQLLNYLKGGGIEVGLLLNFGSSSLQWKRMISSKKEKSV
jgi:GxxExxY protein